MRKILIAVDGFNPSRTRTAVAEAMGIGSQEPVELHLLSVQPPVSSHVAMFFSRADLRDLHQDSGLEELAQPLEQLRKAGIDCQSWVRVGRRAETIARAARELGCDRILMGQAGGEPMTNRVLGSLVAQVRTLVGSQGDCQVLGS